MTGHEAAKPKRQREDEFEDAPQKESIRGMSPKTIRRNPSTDQKRVRREMQRKIAGEETDLSRLLVEAAANDNPFEVTASDDLPEGSSAAPNNLMDTPCEGCGKPLGPEVFLSKWPVCGKCTRKRHKEVTGAALPLGSPSKAPSNEPGDMKCRSCDYSGAPVMGDSGSPSCRNCNSYSIQPVKHAASKTAATTEREPDAESRRRYPDIQSVNGGNYCSKHAPSYTRVSEPTAENPCKTCGGVGWKGEGGKEAAKTATQFDTTADRVNPGDMIRTPTGQTVKVLRMRNHETSPGHAYMDTDQGTSVIRRKAPVQIVPFNSQQQQLPGYGTQGGNTNSLPMEKGDTQHGPGGSNVATSQDCPVCGGKGTLHRQGNNYVCSKCGYRENVGAAGAGQGINFSDIPQRLMGQPGTQGPGHQGPGFPIASSLKSAIARRAQEVLDSTEENQ